MAKKLRVSIPDDIAADILFLSDRTCCVCNTRGKQVQIHHIDENPANNDIDNLSVLCFDCHDQTMIKGGFGRKLDAKQIIMYRSEWLERVKNRKVKADEIASVQTVTGSTKTVIVHTETVNLTDDFLNYKTHDDPDILKEYLDKILIIHQAQLTIAQTKWDSGVTANMNQGNYDIIDFYEEVLIELSTFYPKGHFNGQTPNNFFSELISSKFQWHRLVLEPEGAGTGGTIVSTMTGGQVMYDLKNMIVDMVNSLLLPYEIDKQIDLNNWREEWLK
jgi:hypothetical protein